MPSRFRVKLDKVKRVRTFAIERSRREISGQKRRASRSGADLFGGDFVSPGGQAFLDAVRFHVEKGGRGNA